MKVSAVRRVFFCLTLLALPAIGYAQEAVLSGTVSDSTGGVLPGVTVQAVHEASGNTFEGVTDGSGAFRLPVRIGSFKITAELNGFTTVTREGVQVQVGQVAVINLQLAPSTVEESVTVTGEAPLIDTSSSSLGGNIDSRQMQELPVQGRDWTGLALLAPGNRTTTMGGVPVQDRADVREFQLNMDGQQVTQTMGTGNQPLYSRDSIAEFQFISNRFDASQGRSSGVQVNAVTKSGTNTLAGSFSGFFRDDAFNAEDHVLNRVVPYSNQQLSATVGGPILRDRLHFFGNFEYDREPRTSIWNTPYPSFNVELNGLATKKMGGVRLDYQLSPNTRLMGKVHRANHLIPFGTGNANHPAATDRQDATSTEYLGSLTQVLGGRSTNEIKVGYAGYELNQVNLTTWSNHWQAANGITTGSPRITFTGFTILGNSNAPRVRRQEMYSFRDDFSTSFTAKGSHAVKVGGEFLFYEELTRNCRNCMGAIDARGGPVPANIEALFPDPFNADTWNLAAISPITRRYNIGISNDFRTPFEVPRFAGWVQDDWQPSSKLTLNLGFRYDLIDNAWANDAELLPFLESGRPDDTNNFQPRLGFAYQVNERTVVRGGAGKYYGDVMTNLQMWTLGNQTIATIGIENNLRPDFAANPFNGPTPTTEQAFARFCDVNGGQTGCLVRAPNELAPPPEYANVGNSWQTSIGVQRQVGDAMAFEVDYVYNRSRNEKVIAGNINIAYDPATGVNYPFSDVNRRPYPLFGVVSMTPYSGYSNYHGLQTALTKRFSNRWQGSLTYTLSGLRNSDPLPMSGLREVTFDVAPDLGDEYTLAITDQRHRLVLNGIWQVAHGFQVSGLYFFGSGERRDRSYGGDLRNFGGDQSERLRPDGSIVPRNALVGDPVHRIDVRLQQRIRLFGRASIDGIFEIFNLFDHANFGTYVEQESSSQFGQPDVNANLAYGPRVMQFGFRFTF